MWTKEDYEKAIKTLQEGMTQLQPDGRLCAICGDTDHQAPECHHNPLVLMARAHRAEGEYRCYHCGTVCTTEAEALAHFGEPAAELDPLCIEIGRAVMRLIKPEAEKPPAKAFGTPGWRDPHAPCRTYQPGLPAGDCRGDGHYLCLECAEFNTAFDEEDPEK